MGIEFSKEIRTKQGASQSKARPNIRIRVISLSIGAAFLTFGLKFLAFFLTGSVGLLSDAMESMVNVVAAFTAFAALTFAARPPDQSHPYGHEKAEFLSSIVEGTLIILAAAVIAWEGFIRLLDPQPLQSLGFGLAVSFAATMVNFGVARVLLHFGKKEDSIALEADGKHLMTDVWTSVGVIVGLGLVWVTGWLWLDAVVAIAIAINIVFEGGRLLNRSLDGLLDRALPKAEETKIRQIIEGVISHQDGPVAYHGLRSRKSGSFRFVDLHLLTPGSWTVQRAFECIEEIETAISAELKNIRILVNTQPIEDPRAHNDSWESNITDL